MRDHHGVFSAPLAEALSGVVDAGEKAILFLNRRGFAAYLVCDHCGHAWECPRLRRHSGAVRQPHPPLPDLRAHRAGAVGLPGVRPFRPGALRLRHGASRARGPPAAARGRPAAPRLGRRRVLRAAAERPRPVRRARAQGARGHADDRQGAPLPGRDPGRRGQRRPHAALSGLPRRGAHVLAAHPGRRPQRPRRAARPGHRADARPRGAADRPRRRRRRRRGSTPRSSSAGRELGYPPAGFLVGLDLSGTSRDKVEVAGRFTAERLAARLGETAQVLGPGPLWRERGRHACRLVIKTKRNRENPRCTARLAGGEPRQVRRPRRPGGPGRGAAVAVTPAGVRYH